MKVNQIIKYNDRNYSVLKLKQTEDSQTFSLQTWDKQR